MSKRNPKKFAQLCRKLVVLADLIIDTIDEIEEYDHDESEFKQDLNKVLNRCCKITEQAHTVDQVRKSTYMQNLSNKIDAVIRNNFEIK